VGEPLLTPLEGELAERLPHARRVRADGDPLHGAVRIAADLAANALALPGDAAMLQVMATERP
jgi:hypothetical protein